MHRPLFFVGGRWTDYDPADFDVDYDIDDDSEYWDRMDRWAEWWQRLDDDDLAIPDPDPYDPEPLYLPHVLTRATRGHVPASMNVRGDHGRHSSGGRGWEKRQKARAERRKARLRPDTPPTYHLHHGWL